MSLFKIKTKSQAAINKTLKTSDVEADNGMQHTDGIACHVTGDTEYSVSAILTSGDYIDIQLDFSTDSGPVFVSPKWIKSASIAGNPITITATSLIGDVYYKLPDGTFYEYATDSIIADLASCPVCGSILTTAGSHLCDTCVNDYAEIHGYNHKPDPIFIGSQSHADAEFPIHYGIELEYAAYNKHEIASLVYNSNKSLYLKSDSSIQGDANFKVEVVSHPHSFSALMDPDSFIHQLPTIAVADGGTANGVHIHISRTAFRDDKHFSLFYFLLSSNRELIEFIGKRQLTSYCRHIVKGLVISKSNKPQPGFERKSFINEQNDHTIEIRFFNSTTDTHVVKSYIQFLDSLIKYSNYHGTSVSLSRWKAYVIKYKSKYAELATRLADYKLPFTGTVKFKPPVVKAVPKTALSFLADLPYITSVSDATKTYQVAEDSRNSIDSDGCLEFRELDHGWRKVHISDITSIQTTKDN